MTTIPGHNIVIQQSGAAQELSHNAQSSKPSPEQAAAQQAVDELAKNTTVQRFDESEKLKTKKEKEKAKGKPESKRSRKKNKQGDMDERPDETGRLLDTMV